MTAPARRRAGGCAAQIALGARVDLGWERRQDRGDLQRPGNYRIGLHNLVEHAQAEALVGVDQLVAERQHARGVWGELGRDHTDRRLRIGNADLDLGQSVATRAGSHPQIGAQRQHQAARDRVAGDRADRRELELIDPERHLVDAGDHRALLILVVVGYRLQVRAGREEPRTPAQHERARRIARHALDRV